ncbi:thrombospondin type 3 repeat-containing protein [Myxococcota bacterium]|nr:thrombospondin type 3 repeat-containing protein [Myxococcota bacterium]
MRLAAKRSSLTLFTLCAALGSAGPASAGVVNWVDWTSSDTNNVYGIITVGTATVGVTYTGERAFLQTACGTDYWVQVSTTNPYTSATVDNPPNDSSDAARRCDLIALRYATQKTLTFSEPVTNPLFAVVSLNGNGYRFDRDFTILSYAQGYWGNGTLTKTVTTHPDGSVTYDLIGSGEPHGVLQFIGTFSTVSWTSLTNEFWNGFTIAVENLAVNVPPELEVSARGQPLANGATLDLGVHDVGTSTSVDVTITNTGTGPLNLAGVDIGGPAAPLFTRTAVPPAIAAGASTTFTLTFTASTSLARTATVTILSDDADEGTFSFVVTADSRVDADGDGVADGRDNCADVPNLDQSDLDGDGAGDVCDDDVDGDGVNGALDCDDADATVASTISGYPDTDGDSWGEGTIATIFCAATLPTGWVGDGGDNCPDDANLDQADLDGDVEGDACDDDVDGDGVASDADCDDRDQSVATSVVLHDDGDGDGLGAPGIAQTFCTATPPAGWVADATDNCPEDTNATQENLDGDAEGDVCDADDDGDGIDDVSDDCPRVANATQENLDGDAEGDACDADDDGDGIDDVSDNCPRVANADGANLDGDAEGDACDADDDGDGIDDVSDNCPRAANATQDDADGDGRGAACDDQDQPDPIDEDKKDGDGCACTTETEKGPATPWLLALLALAVIGRRTPKARSRRSGGPAA